MRQLFNSRNQIVCEAKKARCKKMNLILQAGLLLTMLLFLTILQGCSPASTAYVDVRDMGAVGDSMTVNTRAIQTAIDEVEASGGGVVMIREGNYVTGTLQLRSGVHLKIDHDARLLGSLDQDHYSDEIATLTDGIGQRFGHALIYGNGVKNVSISGGGTIDGRGYETYFSRQRGDKRPSIIRFENSDSVTVSGVTLTNAAFWVQHYRNSVNIVVDSVQVISHSNGNNDGIDIDGSRNVRISNSSFDTGDDSIVLKSLSDHEVANVIIENNTITGDKSAVKTGTESVGAFRNVTIRDLEIKGTRGINLYTVDGADLIDFTVRDIRMDSSYGVLMIRLGERMNSFDGSYSKKEPGRLEQIVIEGIKATNVMRNNDFIAGLPEHPVRSVSITDLHIEYSDNADINTSRGPIPERASAYPKDGMFGDLPAHGMYIRHATKIDMNGIQFLYPGNWDPDPAMPLIKCEHTDSISVNWLISSTDRLNEMVSGC